MLRARALPATLWRALVGSPLETQRLRHERLTKVKGLAVFGADALSSSAYATEEILRVLVLAGVGAVALTVPVSLAIVALMAIVAISYYQTIHAYPSGGGAYIVAHENLGLLPGLVAAAALLVDYILTVAVSISAGVAAITSALPELYPHRVELALGFIALITVANLRGVRESGTIFAIPTYSFILAFGAVITFGVWRWLNGTLPDLTPAEPPAQVQPLTLLLLLRAFASGTAALTGIEAVSNGVQAFYPPEPRNASRVLLLMVALLGSFFFGTGVLAREMGILPREEETVVSQIARAVFEGSWPYYAVQAATMLILVLAANTAFADFPRLASILARDRYLPRQLANLGDRLVFANGILLLGATASLLIVIFRATVHNLIPLYMVGVFVAFTLSQAGMVRHWWTERSGQWRLKLGINGFGALCTAAVGIEVAVIKFLDGAWITVFVIGSFVVLMRAIHRHYEDLKHQLSLERAKLPRPFRAHKVIVPVNNVHRGVLEALRYAKAVSDDVTAVYVEIEPGAREEIERKWERWVPDVPLVVLPSPYRSVVGPILLYLDQVQREAGPDTALTVVLPEFVPRKWWHHLLHNQTALMLKFALLFRQRRLRRYKVLADVPYYLTR
ncbi:MAG: APC family permease [Armatimonadota bacterium]|nr:APC family permease [Armatimonadota bacterium]MDR7577637.1 APC family permease [Armatimonadota bacterium]MDR7579939.1 APC family permease [Armatimonadota bacterium]MDR7615843.1 APC family permease [Armatimonadota bacterium]